MKSRICWITAVVLSACGNVADIDDVGTAAELVDATLPAPVTNPAGFTAFKKSPDGHIYYVSMSGDDKNDGLAPTKALKTAAAGLKKLRNGYPDWLLFERGGTWEGGLGNWSVSGRSTAEPIIVSAYGAGARPLFRTGGGSGIDSINSTGAGPHHDHVWFVGLSFYANRRDPDSPDFNASLGSVEAIHWRTGTTDLLVEDCVLRFYGIAATFQDSDKLGMSGIRLRRNQFLDSYNPESVGHSQGVYLAATHGVLFEENIFDHNGWNDRVSGAQPTIFNHNLYVDNGNTNVVLQSNVFLRAASHGVQLRPGGVAINNLFAYNAVGLLLGGGTNPEAGGVAGQASYNVILQGTDIGSTPKQYGIDMSNIRAFTVSYNIVADSTTSNAHQALANTSGSTYLSNTVYNWPLGQNMSGSYTDPRRDLASYDRSLGGPGTFEHLVTGLRAQSQQSWRTQYMAQAITLYFRQGFH